MNKIQSQRIHAKRRAEERYDLQLNRHDLKSIVKIIQKGNTLSSIKQNNRVSVHMLYFNEVKIRVVYDKIRKTIVSFLPLRDNK